MKINITTTQLFHNYMGFLSDFVPDFVGDNKDDCSEGELIGSVCELYKGASLTKLLCGDTNVIRAMFRDGETMNLLGQETFANLSEFQHKNRDNQKTLNLIQVRVSHEGKLIAVLVLEDMTW